MTRPRPRAGQHFLSDPRILGRIADALEPAPGDVVLEIGAGKGSLTRALLARGLRVIAIEKDRRLAAALREAGWEMRDASRLVLVEGDALECDWHELLSGAPHPASRIPHPGFKVVGNIPYALTTPLIEKALVPPVPARIVFLVQAEVAARLAARPGARAYGALTVGVQAACRVERLFAVKPGAFSPPPRVTSALVRLTPLAEPLVPPADGAALRAFVTACFSRRRKQLRNVLARVTGRAAGEVEHALARLGLDRAARPETLPPEGFVRLLRWAETL